MDNASIGLASETFINRWVDYYDAVQQSFACFCFGYGNAELE